jgi:hypothetical protein
MSNTKNKKDKVDLKKQLDITNIIKKVINTPTLSSPPIPFDPNYIPPPEPTPPAPPPPLPTPRVAPIKPVVPLTPAPVPMAPPPKPQTPQMKQPTLTPISPDEFPVINPKDEPETNVEKVLDKALEVKSQKKNTTELPEIFSERMDNINDFITKHDEMTRRKQQMEKGVIGADILGTAASAFSRPSITAAEIMAGVTPKDHSDKIKQQIESPTKSKYLFAGENIKDLLDRYKATKDKTELLGAYQMYKDTQSEKDLKEWLQIGDLAKFADKRPEKEGLSDEEKLRLRSEHEMNLQEARDKAALERARIAAASAERRARETAAGRHGPLGPQSAGQKSLDQKFATEVVEWQKAGGLPRVMKELKTLREALDNWEDSAWVSGRALGAVNAVFGQAGRQMVSQKSYDLERSIREVTTSSLKPILGGQFAEKEGERLLQLSFNPMSKASDNKRRLEMLYENIKLSGELKDKAVRYFLKNKGTLAGYEDHIPTYLPEDKELRAKTLEELGDSVGRIKTADDFIDEFGSQVAGDRIQSHSKSKPSSGGKTVVRRQYSPSRNQTKIIYSDGTTEIVEGKK